MKLRSTAVLGLSLLALGAIALGLRDKRDSPLPVPIRGAGPPGTVREPRTRPSGEPGLGSLGDGKNGPTAGHDGEQALSVDGAPEETRHVTARQRAKALAGQDLPLSQLLMLLAKAQDCHDGIELAAALEVVRKRLVDSTSERGELMAAWRRSSPEQTIDGLVPDEVAMLLASVPGSDTADFIREIFSHVKTPEDAKRWARTQAMVLSVLGRRGAAVDGVPPCALPDDAQYCRVQNLERSPSSIDEAGIDLLVELFDLPALDSASRNLVINSAGRFQPTGRTLSSGEEAGPTQVLTQALTNRFGVSTDAKERTLILDVLGTSSLPTARDFLLAWTVSAPAKEERLAALSGLGHRPEDPVIGKFLMDRCEMSTETDILIEILLLPHSFIKGNEEKFLEKVSTIARRHPDSVTRGCALRAFGETNLVDAIPVVEEAASLEPDPEIRDQAREVLQQLKSCRVPRRIRK